MRKITSSGDEFGILSNYMSFNEFSWPLAKFFVPAFRRNYL